MIKQIVDEDYYERFGRITQSNSPRHPNAKQTNAQPEHPTTTAASPWGHLHTAQRAKPNATPKHLAQYRIFRTLHPMKPQALIIRAAGTNCDTETGYAFQIAGADTGFIHINRIPGESRHLNDFQLLARFPADSATATISPRAKSWRIQIVHHLRDPLRRFVEDGKPVIGICNGFQVLVENRSCPVPSRKIRPDHALHQQRLWPIHRPMGAHGCSWRQMHLDAEH